MGVVSNATHHVVEPLLHESVTDTLRPYFLLVIQRFSFLRGNSVLRWTCWNQNSLSLDQRFPLLRETYQSGSTIHVLHWNLSYSIFKYPRGNKSLSRIPVDTST